jgi:hypothetical protein
VRDLLATDFSRDLIASKALEGSVTEKSIGSPVCESDLGHKLGSDPYRPTGCLSGQCVKKTRRSFHAVQFLPDLAMALFRKSSTGSAGIDQTRRLIVPTIVVTKEQGTDAFSPGLAFAGESKTTDHKLLLMETLQFDP